MEDSLQIYPAYVSSLCTLVHLYFRPLPLKICILVLRYSSIIIIRVWDLYWHRYFNDVKMQIYADDPAPAHVFRNSLRRCRRLIKGTAHWTPTSRS